jgi:hypothetical protein
VGIRVLIGINCIIKIASQKYLLVEK